MIKGKVVVVTGGLGLIGQEFIKAILDNGGVAIIADINENFGKELIETFSTKYKRANIDFIKLDITSKDNLMNSIEVIHKKHGKIDALVNCAYPRNENYGKHFFEVQYNDFILNLGCNLGGYFLASQQYANYFKQQGFGNIVNISSVYGVVAPKFEIYDNTKMTVPVEYAAIKSALIHLTKYMAKYFKGMNIRVNSISPGGVIDNQPKPFLDSYKKECLNKGMLDKSDLNGSLIYLLSDMSQYVNGQNIVVDDGFSV